MHIGGDHDDQNASPRPQASYNVCHTGMSVATRHGDTAQSGYIPLSVRRKHAQLNRINAVTETFMVYFVGVAWYGPRWSYWAALVSGLAFLLGQWATRRVQT